MRLGWPRVKIRTGSAAAVPTREVAVGRRKRPTQRSEECLELRSSSRDSPKGLSSLLPNGARGAWS